MLQNQYLKNYKDWKQKYIIDRAPWGYPINLKF